VIGLSFEKVHGRILLSLKDKDLRKGSVESTRDERKNRLEAFNRHPYVVEWAKEVRSIKEQMLQDSPKLIGEFRDRFEKNGGHFHFAKDGDDLKRELLQVVGKGGLLVKSKSLVGEEVALRQFLQSNGTTVFETDLGEFLVQLTNGVPAHMVTPAVNMTESRARKVLEPYVGSELPNVESMVLGVRKFMREKFFDADVGLVGANALAADTGSAIFITNEGNGALTSILPSKLIIITSIEKVYPRFTDAIKACVVQTNYSGFMNTSYIHAINGPSAGALGPKEVHLILLDNGRTKAMGGLQHMSKKAPTFRDERMSLSETLYCLKCGACQLACPVFKEVDGAWGGQAYTAAIGIPWTAITGSPTEAKALSYFCLGCGKCKEICPMGIDIPELIRRCKSI